MVWQHPQGCQRCQVDDCHVEKSTTDDPDPSAQAVALQSLLTIFEQINAHPEEVNSRRIRRNHDQFVQHIGLHDGGVQILIAAGFTLGATDEVLHANCPESQILKTTLMAGPTGLISSKQPYKFWRKRVDNK